MVHVLQTAQDLVITRSCFAEDGKEIKCTKNYNARAQTLFVSLCGGKGGKCQRELEGGFKASYSVDGEGRVERRRNVF